MKDNVLKNLQISRKNRSNHWKCSVKVGVLKSFANFTGKQLSWRLFFNKVTNLRPATLLKRDSSTGVFL